MNPVFRVLTVLGKDRKYSQLYRKASCGKCHRRGENKEVTETKSDLAITKKMVEPDIIV